MRKNILIIDDLADNRLILKIYLSKQGYNVSVAKDGAEALTMIATTKPALIISDIMMPKMGGFEFLETLKAKILFGNIPVILMSAKEKDLVTPVAKDLMAHAFLEKPVDLAKLKRTVHSILSGVPSLSMV
jgi:CheY-like chemotaxis protein